MKRLRAEFASFEFLRFLLAGGVAALVNVLSRRALSEAMSYPRAIVLAYLAGMAVAYALNRRLVFGRGQRALSSEILWFGLVNLAGVLQTLGVSLFLARVVLAPLRETLPVETLAHCVGVGVPAFTSFIGHKYLTFRKAAGSDGAR